MLLASDAKNLECHLIEQTETVCPRTGARHAVITARRKHPAVYGVYVGHPISGIRVGRILEMQDRVRTAFGRCNAGSVQRTALYFPMRTTHLAASEVGANEYHGAEGLFTDTRHFTLQNRQDAVCNADGVLINYDLRDDDGRYRLSKGIPFDYGWARALGKPVVAVIGPDNPNWTDDLGRTACHVTEDLDDGIRVLNAMLPHAAARSEAWSMCVEVFDFTGCGPALDMIAKLAEADVRKHTLGGRAIVTVMPDGDRSPNYHGQVRQVSDWLLPSRDEAARVVRHLLGV